MSEDNGASFFSSYIALWEQISRRLFGDDIFISYSRADGFSYAAALATRLAERKLACRFDQWGTEPGGKSACFNPKICDAQRLARHPGNS